MHPVWMAILGANLFAFGLYGWDKWMAIRGKRRVPERWLLLVAALFGALGAWSGVRMFRHKTRKRRFLLALAAASALNLVWAWIWWRGSGP